MYKVYRSAQKALNMMTPTGGRIIFTDFKCITKNEKFIEYLDKEIAEGFPFVKCVGDMSEEDYIKQKLHDKKEKEKPALVGFKTIQEVEAEEKKFEEAVAAELAKHGIQAEDSSKSAPAAKLNPASTAALSAIVAKSGS